MAAELRRGHFPWAGSASSSIYDPKERIITAPCFAERVLHHAIMNVCEPVFERWLIADTLPAAAGRAASAALCCGPAVRRPVPVLPQARHPQVFRQRVARPVCWNCWRGGSRTGGCWTVRPDRAFVPGRTLGRGLPIGSLTSQHFANFYLGWFDRFVKESLRVPAYVRYMDDMALWAESMAELRRTACDAADGFPAGRAATWSSSRLLTSTARSTAWTSSAAAFSRTTWSSTAAAASAFAGRLAWLERRVTVPGRSTNAELQHRATALIAFTRTPGAAQLAVPAARAKTAAGERSRASNRVNRGGSWNNNAGNCRAANRNRNTPANRNNNLGFRLARSSAARRSCSRRNRPLSVPVQALAGRNRIQWPPGAGSRANAPGGPFSLTTAPRAGHASPEARKQAITLWRRDKDCNQLEQSNRATAVSAGPALRSSL